MNQERVFQVLLGPHVSEKAAIVAELSNQYVFRVAGDATKHEVKKAVEQLLKVSVSDVQTLNVKGKLKRNKVNNRVRRRHDQRVTCNYERLYAVDSTSNDNIIVLLKSDITQPGAGNRSDIDQVKTIILNFEQPRLAAIASQSQMSAIVRPSNMHRLCTNGV